MGVLDEYRIPKKSFYMYRYNWTGAPYDTFVVGSTPTHIQLDADLTTITADSTVLMICDPRLVARPYGKLFLQSLPPMRRTRSLSEVQEFFTLIDSINETASA